MNDRQSEQQDETPQPLYVSLILDESGSMQSCKRAAIEGFNKYIKSLQELRRKTWASPRTAVWPFRKRISGKRSTSCRP